MVQRMSLSMDENVKKNLPFILGGVIIIGGIIYLRRNSTAGPSVNTGYSVVNPPDNSASIAAATAAQQSQFQLAGTGLAALTQLTSESMKEKYLLTSESQAQTAQINLATIQSANEIEQLHINADVSRAQTNAALEAARIQSDFQLRSLESQNNTALAVAREQSAAAINQRNTDAAVQNNAIKTQGKTAQRASTTSAIVSLAMIAMMFFCYEDTDGALMNRRIYGHQDPRHQFPGPKDLELSDVVGPSWRSPRNDDISNGSYAYRHAGAW